MVCPNSINSSWLALRDVEGRLCWTDPKQRSVCGAETSETCEDRRTEVQTLVMLILVLEKSTTRWNPWRNQSGRTETVVSEQETAESLERETFLSLKPKRCRVKPRLISLTLITNITSTYELIEPGLKKKKKQKPFSKWLYYHMSLSVQKVFLIYLKYIHFFKLIYKVCILQIIT